MPKTHSAVDFYLFICLFPSCPVATPAVVGHH